MREGGGFTTKSTKGTKVQKAEIRLEQRGRMASLDPEIARQAADSAAERVLALPEMAQAEGVLACLSFGGEIDTWGLVERLLADRRRVYVPRAESGSRLLHVHPYSCELQTLPFGLKQPRAGTEQLAEKDIDSRIGAVLVLGLAFDRSGYRLGRGAGCFDRFLAGRPFPSVGLAYQFQIVDRLPIEPHDVPMTVVATEQETIRPQRRDKRRMPAPVGAVS